MSTADEKVDTERASHWLAKLVWAGGGYACRYPVASVEQLLADLAAARAEMERIDAARAAHPGAVLLVRRPEAKP